MGVGTFVIVAILGVMIMIFTSQKCDLPSTITACKQQVNDPETCKSTCKACKP